jgi:chemotaxis protein MotB
MQVSRAILAAALPAVLLCSGCVTRSSYLKDQGEKKNSDVQVNKLENLEMQLLAVTAQRDNAIIERDNLRNARNAGGNAGGNNAAVHTAELDNQRTIAKAAQQEAARLTSELIQANQRIKNLESAPKGATAGPKKSEEDRILLKSDVAFKTASAELTKEGEAELKEVAKKLNAGENAKFSVIVEGHTDDAPVVREESKKKFHDNWGLSALRSAAVLRELIESGVKPERLRGSYVADQHPVVKGSSPEDRAKNRRIEIFLAD